MCCGFLRGFCILLGCMSAGCSEIEGGVGSMWERFSRLFGRTQSQVSLLDEASIPEVPVEYLGEIELELQDKIELFFDEEAPGIGYVNSMVITPDQSFIFADGVSHEVHEFSLQDGSYIRSFGRRGEGPGEYGQARYVTMDPTGYVYVYDAVKNHLLRYEREGTYLDHLRTRAVIALSATRSSDVLFLAQDYPANRLIMQKVTPKSWQERYSIGLSTRNNDHPNIRSPNWLGYHSTLDRVYFLGSNDYQVKEIDVSTGKKPSENYVFPLIRLSIKW
ncbi:MAG: 6-bladed beta-propeller, partial [Gemmatimonadetes bacterium]|nr:6-bladed beta-propeller [Gemmatimonadota bacterium]MXY83211.1 6-bladed beta-propeller [Gemmatimonadota bacterium]MYB68692.1 6-bladed beta-propeller [Gemmatimonadota bacterium]